MKTDKLRWEPYTDDGLKDTIVALIGLDSFYEVYKKNGKYFAGIVLPVFTGRGGFKTLASTNTLEKAKDVCERHYKNLKEKVKKYE